MGRSDYRKIIISTFLPLCGDRTDDIVMSISLGLSNVCVHDEEHTQYIEFKTWLSTLAIMYSLCPGGHDYSYLVTTWVVAKQSKILQ